MSDAVIREFDSGATRSDDPNRLDFEGFLSPTVLRRYAQYLNKHRKQADGVMRDSDNWQKGIPLEVYMKSATRHFIDLWAGHRRAWGVDIEESCCAILFNVMGYLFETLKIEDAAIIEESTVPCFKKGDIVRIKLRSGLDESMTIPVERANMVGKYLRNGAGLCHLILVAGEDLWLHDDEITLLEDN